MIGICSPHLSSCWRSDVALSLTAADCAESGSSNGEEKAGKADAGPSCSSLSSKAAGDSKSRFFDDSEESEEGEEEEEGSDEEVRTGDQNRFGCEIFPDCEKQCDNFFCY